MTDALTRAVVEAARLCVAAEDALHGDFAVADVLSVGATMRGLRAALHALDAAPAEPEAAGTVDAIGASAAERATWGASPVIRGSFVAPDRLAALEEVARAAEEADRFWRMITLYGAGARAMVDRMDLVRAALRRARRD
jgi:hypothetical protein